MMAYNEVYLRCAQLELGNLGDDTQKTGSDDGDFMAVRGPITLRHMRFRLAPGQQEQAQAAHAAPAKAQKNAPFQPKRVRFPTKAKPKASALPPKAAAMTKAASKAAPMPRQPQASAQGSTQASKVQPEPEVLAALSPSTTRPTPGTSPRWATCPRARWPPRGLDCTFTATSSGVSTGSDGVRRRDELGHALRSSSRPTRSPRPTPPTDLFLKNWAGWSKLQISNNSAASDSGPELGQPERQGLPGAGRWHQCELIMINDEALAQSLDAAVLKHEPEEGNTGNVVCNTSFTNLLDSRAKTEMTEADRAPAALRLRGGQAVQTPGHEPGPEAGLRLGRLRRNGVEEPDASPGGATARRWSDSTTRTLPACSGGCPGPEAWQARRRTSREKNGKQASSF